MLFTAGRSSRAALTRQIESAVSSAFSYDCRIILRSLPQMQAVVAGAPKDFGERPAAYRDDVIFLRDSLTAAEAMRSVTTTAGVDRATAGDGVVYFSRLISKASQSRRSRLAGTPAYQHLTIRNWNTTRTLLERRSSGRT